MLKEIKRAHVKGTAVYCWYLCSCGVKKIICKSNVTQGKVRSCGCYKREKMRNKKTTHGMTKTATYVSWIQMRTRCNNSNYAEFKYYGGRGIKICKRWDKFENFLKDMGVRPCGKTLDRKNTNANYTPNNCRWATYAEQCDNKRTNVKIKTPKGIMTITKAAKIFKIQKTTIARRIKEGWPENKLLVPVNSFRNKTSKE